MTLDQENAHYMAESFVVLARQKLQDGLYHGQEIDQTTIHDAIGLLSKAEEQIKWARSH